MESIIQKEKECFICKNIYNLHSHHIFGGVANRKLSEQDGMKVWLCAPHHNMSDAGIHFDKNLDLRVKRVAQLKWQEYYGKTEDDFRKRYGKSYL